VKWEKKEEEGACFSVKTELLRLGQRSEEKQLPVPQMTRGSSIVEKP